jgi:hypothetical protein
MPQPIRVTPSTRDGLAKSTFTIASGGIALRCMLLNLLLCVSCIVLLLIVLSRCPSCCLPLLLLSRPLPDKTAVHNSTLLPCCCLPFGS